MESHPSAPSAPPAPVRRVLFVGDSLTYVNDLDLHVRHFAEAAGYASPSLFIDRAVKGGAPLKTLWKKTDARQRIAKEGFDVVVLQEDLPETDVATFHDYAARFHEHCQAAGAATVLLMAWPYERLDWISTEGIAEAHGSIASRLGARVAPVGLAWQRALKEKPKTRLYAKDKEHPALLGTYLAAAVVFAVLWCHNPSGLQHFAQGAVSTQEAAFLQRVAWETVQSYGAHPARTSLRAVSSCAGDRERQDLICKLFSALDADKDSILSAQELRPFACFLGFPPGAKPVAWAEEFTNLCSEVGSSQGVPLEGFRQLVDKGTEKGLYSTHCTSEELADCLTELASPKAAASKAARVVIVPGNGGGSVWDSNWYGWLALELRKRGVEVALMDMPDPVRARENVWLPFIVDTLAGGMASLADTVVVGHSSGAVAAMRLAERHQLRGVVLVAAYTSDLGDSNERRSGYFSRPWDWAAQKANAGFVVQFASTNDPFLPINEQRAVRNGLKPLVEYVELHGRSHFFAAPFRELLEVLEQRLGLT